MAPSKVLILGCGYLGTRVGTLCHEQGMIVTGTTRNSQRFAELAALGFKPEILDLAHPTASKLWGEPHDFVLYAMAAGRSGNPELAFASGALACARLLRECEVRPRAFVFISSTGVYGQNDGAVVDEESAANPAAARPQLLRKGEEELLEFSRKEDFPVVILRLGGLYGPGRSPLEWLGRPDMRERLSRGGHEAYMNWVRVEDAARAAVLAFERGGAGEIYLVVDDEPVRRGEFLSHAASQAKLPALSLPSRPTELGKRCSNRKARLDLGFRPAFPTYREGLVP